MILLVMWLAVAPAPNSWTCKEVHAAIKMAGSVEQAESIARSIGLSDGLIEKARKCVRNRPRINGKIDQGQ